MDGDGNEGDPTTQGKSWGYRRCDDGCPGGSQLGKAAPLLKKLRERAGLTMDQIAEDSLMRKTSYAYYENSFKGDYLPRKPNLLRIRDALGRRGASEADLDNLFGVASDVELADLRDRLSNMEKRLERTFTVMEEIRDALRNKK